MKEKIMNIYYDYQILYMQRYGGISRYYYDLITEIEKNPLVKTEIHCKYNTNHYFVNTGDIKLSDAFFHVKPTILRRALRLYGHKVNQAVTKRCVKRADILHMTYYYPYALEWPDVKKVVTVYDMIQEVFRRNDSLDFIIENKKRCIHEADHIIAISESTKKDILRIYPDVNEDKISVIYIGSSLKKSDDAKQVLTLPKRYVLYVGVRDGYKNFETLLEAMKPLLKKDDSLYILCVGGGAFTSDEKERIGVYEKRVIQMDADDRILVAAYSHALCFVFPSLYEGFGIPTLEAFTCDCPVVLSNTSSMPEVGGDAVLYCDPVNREDIQEQIRKVIYNEELRLKMIDKGRERLKLFSWDQIARQTVECYRSVLKSQI